jgi:N-acetylmuramoyl-L-alanine amidase
MQISNHKLVGVPYKAATASGGAMTPTLILLHDTAGRLDKGSSVSWFCSKECPTSAHLVVERDGSVTQMVPFNKKAFHAGRSSWKGKEFCNSYAIGIEIVNPGELDASGKAWFGETFPDSVRKTTKEHGTANWIGYTPEQIEAVTAICKALAEKYAIEDISTHWFVSPKRKVDPGPLFPLEELRAAVFPANSPIALAAPMPSPQPVHKVSRKMKAASAGEKTAAGGGIVIFGFTLAELFGYAQQFSGFVREYGVELTIGALFATSVAFAAIKHFTKEDVEDGRYVPSGEAK